MSYSRRSRFTDGKSSLHRVEFAREFETHLVGSDGRDGPRETRRVTSPVEPDRKPGVSQREIPVIGVHRDPQVRRADPAGEGSDDADEQGLVPDAAMASAPAKTRHSRRPML